MFDESESASARVAEDAERSSFMPLYVTTFFGTLNDNFVKTLAGFTVISWIADARVKSIAMGVTAGALVLPYILCSPLADRLTAVWAKQRIIRAAKWAELPIMLVAIAGLAFKSPWLVVGAVLLMGLQSSLYSPAKYALVRDIGGMGRISTGMGGMEGMSFLGVLAGTVAGAVVADLEVRHPEWNLSYFCLVAFAACGLAASYTIHAREEKNRALHAVNPIRYVRRVRRIAARCDGDDYYFSDATQEAGDFLRTNAARFDGIGGFKNHFAQENKTLHIINSPENVLQTKAAGQILKELLKDETKVKDTAIVLAVTHSRAGPAALRNHFSIHECSSFHYVACKNLLPLVVLIACVDAGKYDGKDFDVAEDFQNLQRAFKFKVV